ncbi:MAG: ABC transporter ATP-binding protein [Spirochaetales bacterium]|nr:ABC transporter ATP-binding protein [Spirochaetales bacterium]
METILRVDNIVKSYGSAFKFGPVSLDVHAGEVIALMGPNGAGKTTLIRLITGLLQKDSGKVESQGMSSKKTKKLYIGYMSEAISIWDDLEVKHQLAFMADLYRVQIPDEITDLVHLLGLDKYMNVRGSHLSQGNRRKLSLILSILHDPEILVLDEPFNGLDSISRKNTIQWIRDRVNKQDKPRAVIIASHQLEGLESFFDRLVVLKDGALS